MSLSNSRVSSLKLLKDIFLSPPTAFENYFKSKDLGQREIRVLHFGLILWAPVFKLIGNSLQFLLKKLLSPEDEMSIELFSGVASVFGFYLFVLFSLRFLDSFRMYHLDRDRLNEYNGPPPHIFALAFLPFSSTGIFWVLPQPFPLLFLFITFFYCLHISFLALQTISQWTSRAFFLFFLKFFLFLSILGFIPLLAYNIYRTFFV